MIHISVVGMDVPEAANSPELTGRRKQDNSDWETAD